MEPAAGSIEPRHGRAVVAWNRDLREQWPRGLRLFVAGLLAWGMFGALHADKLIGHQPLSMDFASYYLAAAVSKQGENFYEVDALERMRQEVKGADRVYPYIYPPVLAQWLQPLATLTPSPAARLWNQLLVLLCGFVAAVIVWSSRRDDWMTAMVVAVFSGLLLTVTDNVRGVGQVTLLLCLLTALAFVAARTSRDVLAGVLLAVATALKLTPGLLIVIWLAERRWKALVGFGISLVAIGGASVAFCGVAPWNDYVRMLQNMSRTGGIPGLLPIATGCFSPTALFLRLGMDSPSASLLALATTCTLAAPIAYLASHARNRGSASIFLAASALVLLGSPYTWHHHIVFLWPAYGLVVEELRSSARPTALFLLLAAGAFCAMNWPHYYERFGIDTNPWGLTMPLFGVLALYVVGLVLAVPNAREPGSAPLTS